MLDDQAIFDAIDDHQIGGDRLASWLYTGEFSLVDSAERSANRDKVVFGDDLVGNEFIGWKRRFGLQDMLFKAGVIEKPVQKLLRFRLPVKRVEIVLNKLLGFSSGDGGVRFFSPRSEVPE